MDSPRASPANTPYQHQHQHQHQHQPQPQQQTTPPPTPQQHHQEAQVSPPGCYKDLDSNAVAAALEMARDSPDGVQDPEVSGTLESALLQIWDRVLAQPNSYVMTRGEFAVFNFYQHMFLGNELATAARGRFWDSPHTR